MRILTTTLGVLVLVATSGAQDTDCVELAKVLKDEYNLKSAHSLAVAYSLLIRMDEQRLIEDVQNHKFQATAEIPIPIADAFVSFLKASLSDESQRRYYEDFKRNFLASQQQFLSEEQLIDFSSRTLKKEAYDLIRTCIERHTTASLSPGLDATWLSATAVVKDKCNPILRITYHKVPLGPQRITIKDIVFRDDCITWLEASPKFPLLFEDGNTEHVKFKRVGSLKDGFPEVSLSISVVQGGAKDMRLPAIPAYQEPVPPPKPEPKPEPKPPPITITKFVVSYQTTTDDKDQNNTVTFVAYYGAAEIGKKNEGFNLRWADGFTYPDFEVAATQAVPLNEWRNLKFHVEKDTDDGWHFKYRVDAVCSDGKRHVVMRSGEKKLGNGHPHSTEDPAQGIDVP